MDFSAYSEIRITTTSNKKYLIYWRYEQDHENGGLYTRKCQVVQYTTGLRVMPIMHEIISKFVKLEMNSKLQLLTEMRLPLGKIQETMFLSDGVITDIFFKK